MRKLIILIVACTLTSCGVFRSAMDGLVEVENPSPVIEEVIKITQESTDLIKKNTDETIRKAEEIQKDIKVIIDKVPPEIKPKIKPEVDNIDRRASEIKLLQEEMKKQSFKMREMNNELRAALVNINIIASQKTELLKLNQQLAKDLAKAKEEKSKALFGKLVYLIIASVVLGALCLVSAFRGDKKAIWGAITAAVVIITSLAISFYMTEFALVGFIAIVGGLALVGYDAYKSHIDKKANKELVHTVEMTKDKLTLKDKREIFGDASLIGKSYMIQSNSTEKIVQKLRKEKKVDWEPIIKK